MPSYSRPLHPALAPLIADCVGYDYRLPADAVHHGLPSTSATVLIAFDEPMDCGWPGAPSERFWTLVAGLHTRPSLVRTHGHQVGIQVAFTPLGVRALTGAPIGEYAGHMLGPDSLELLPSAVHERLQLADWPTRLELLEDALLRRLCSAEAGLRPELSWAWRRLTEGVVPIADLAGELGWSRRHLLAQVRGEFGLDPRTIRRLGRFERARTLADGGVPLAEVAARTGYADQAHLTREWRGFAAATPRQSLGEFPIVQESVGGVPA